MGGAPRFTPHPPEVRRRAIELAQQPGSSLAGTAREMGIDVQTLRRWLDQARPVVVAGVDDQGEADLVLSDAGQALAVHAAVYRSARTAGLLHERADRVAAHAAAHLVGQLRAYGYRLSVEWVSGEARTALEAARGSGVGPPLVDPNSITWEEPEPRG